MNSLKLFPDTGKPSLDDERPVFWARADADLSRCAQRMEDVAARHLSLGLPADVAGAYAPALSHYWKAYKTLDRLIRLRHILKLDDPSVFRYRLGDVELLKHDLWTRMIWLRGYASASEPEFERELRRRQTHVLKLIGTGVLLVFALLVGMWLGA